MRIGVIMGGISSEREISLKSGEEVIKNLNREKYEDIVPIIINSKKEVVEKLKNIDFAFLALHGKFREDGKIQAVLETLSIPYSGCGVLTSAICMNKSLTKTLAKSVGINTAPWIVVKSVNKINYKKIGEIGYPIFIKPNNGGSSVATFFIKSEEEVENAVREGLKYDNEIIIEKYIKGDEITSFILEGEVFPTVMIKAKKGEFFDYSSKYENNGANEEVVMLEANLQNDVTKISKKLWNLLECKSFCRVDMIVREKVPYLLEINTLPGMTKTSLIPKSAGAKGMSFSELLDKIIDSSLE